VGFWHSLTLMLSPFALADGLTRSLRVAIASGPAIKAPFSAHAASGAETTKLAHCA